MTLFIQDLLISVNLWYNYEYYLFFCLNMTIMYPVDSSECCRWWMVCDGSIIHTQSDLYAGLLSPQGLIMLTDCVSEVEFCEILQRENRVIMKDHKWTCVCMQNIKITTTIQLLLQPCPVFCFFLFFFSHRVERNCVFQYDKCDYWKVWFQRESHPAMARENGHWVCWAYMMWTGKGWGRRQIVYIYIYTYVYI